MADRYAVPFQCFIANGTGIITEVGRQATAGNVTIHATQVGTFTFTLGSGCTGIVSDDQATVTGGHVDLVAGANAVEVASIAGGQHLTLNLTLGTAANTNTVNTWSATSGGVSGASIPTSADNFYADANSFTAASQVVTVDATANCLSMDWTGATNTPTLTMTNYIEAFGNIKYISAMVMNGVGNLYCNGVANTTLDTGGLTLTHGIIYVTNANKVTLLSNLTALVLVKYAAGELDTNSKALNLSSFEVATIANKTITLGSSIVNTANWDMATGGGVVTLTVNTSVINCSGNFSGGGLTTYNTVNLTGATSTITGNNTFATLGFTRAGVQTITATGTTQTATNFVRDGGVTVKTLVNGTYTKSSSGRIILPYYSISGATFNPAGVWYFPKSTDGGTNTNANFTYPSFMGAGWWVLSH
jgi:hypothetical protein